MVAAAVVVVVVVVVVVRCAELNSSRLHSVGGCGSDNGADSDGDSSGCCTAPEASADCRQA